VLVVATVVEPPAELFPLVPPLAPPAADEPPAAEKPPEPLPPDAELDEPPAPLPEPLLPQPNPMAKHSANSP
jgi:hypothetical protein